jgi:hypothetical protein
LKGARRPQLKLATRAALLAAKLDGVPQFCSDGYGPGTPEFREQLEQYMQESLVGVRMAIAFLGFSKYECVEKVGNLENSHENSSIDLANWFKDTHDGLSRLASIVRAAEVRQLIAIESYIA